MTPDVLKALRVIALAEADERTFDAWYKSLCRWYSREFSTSLPQVLEFPMEVVFTTYFEDVFWKLANGDEKQREALQDLITGLLSEEHEEFKDMATQEQEEDDEWYQEELARIEKELKSKKSNKINTSQGGMDSDIGLDNPNLSKEDQNGYIEINDEIVPDDEGN